VATVDRALARASRAVDRQLNDVADEFREQRLALGQSQAHVAVAARITRNRYGEVESGRCRSVTVAELHRLAAVLGLSISLRAYPAGPAVRDVGHARRLTAFLESVAAPLSYRVEVPLPQRLDRTELRAWDSVVYGNGVRTAIELEMRIRDVQAVRRRIDLKRRDDPTERFLLLLAGTRSNRRVMTEFAALFADLPALRAGEVRKALQRGEHPPSGLLFV